MNKYITFSIQIPETADAELILGLVSDFEIEGLEEKENLIEVYVSSEEKDNYIEFLNQLDAGFKLNYTFQELESKNWNELWESNFEPVVVNEKIGIRATFHDSLSMVEKEIVIQPKMSFGTGHHATTAQMLDVMQGLDFKNKSVLDLGSGTGVLAIYAEMLGSEDIIALDNDEWCFKNAEDNIELNGCKNIRSMLGSIDVVENIQFDIILANIHKNFHLEHIEKYYKMLTSNAYILLSGFYETDAPEILKLALEHNLIANYYTSDNNWVVVVLYKK